MGFGLFDDGGPALPSGQVPLAFEMDFCAPLPADDVLNDFDFDSFLHETGSSGQGGLQDQGNSRPPLPPSPSYLSCLAPCSVIEHCVAPCGNDANQELFTGREGSALFAGGSGNLALGTSPFGGQVQSASQPRSKRSAPSPQVHVAALSYYKDAPPAPPSGKGAPPPPPPSRKAAPAHKEDIFEMIVSLQLFTGAWQWNEELLGSMFQLSGTELDALFAPLNGQFGGLFKTETHLLATGLVLAFLEKRMAGERDEWEMLGEKARGWMEGELGGVLSAGEFVEKVKGVI